MLLALDARHVAHFTKKRRARTRSRCAQIVGNNHSPHRNTRTSSASVGWGQLQRWLIIFMWVRHYERPLYSHFNNCYYKICISAALKKCSFNNSGPLLTYESPFGNNWSRTVLKPCCLNMLLAPTCLKTSFFFFFLPLYYSLLDKCTSALVIAHLHCLFILRCQPGVNFHKAYLPLFYTND